MEQINPITVVKVFSVTKARDRDGLGDRITTWLRANPEVTVSSTVVRLSSDSRFHCLSIVLFGSVLSGALGT